MRSVVYGAIITAFLASAGTVHAENELDGKSLICKEEGFVEIYFVFTRGTFGGRADNHRCYTV